MWFGLPEFQQQEKDQLLMPAKIKMQVSTLV
jgi:hypothetical protein